MIYSRGRVWRYNYLAPGAVFDSILDEFLDRLAPENKVKRRLKRNSLKSKPRAAKDTHDETAKRVKSRRIPQASRDKVFIRDNGQCTYNNHDVPARAHRIKTIFLVWRKSPAMSR